MLKGFFFRLCFFFPPLFLFSSDLRVGRCEHLSTRSCHTGWTSCRRQQQQQQQPVSLPEPHAKRPPVPGQTEGGAAAHACRGPRRVLPLLPHLKSHDMIFHHTLSLQQRVTCSFKLTVQLKPFISIYFSYDNFSFYFYFFLILIHILY